MRLYSGHKQISFTQLLISFVAGQANAATPCSYLEKGCVGFDACRDPAYSHSETFHKHMEGHLFQQHLPALIIYQYLQDQLLSLHTLEELAKPIPTVPH